MLTVVNCAGFSGDGLVPKTRTGHACLFREDDRA